MIREITLMTRRWLEDETYGFAALLPGLPKEDTDTLPSAPTLYDDYSDESVAVDIEPTKVPALVVWTERVPGEMLVKNRRPGYDINAQVMVGYVVRGTPVLKARKEGAFVLRAVMRSLALLDFGRISEDARVLNGIKIVDILSVDEERVTGSVGKSTLVGLVTMTLKAMDTAPVANPT